MIDTRPKAIRCKTGLPGISVYTSPDRPPRYTARYSDRHLGSFQTVDQAEEARKRAIDAGKQGLPLPPVRRWREQVGTTGIKKSVVAGETMYRYEINLTKPTGKIHAIRSQWFRTEGEALVARMKALAIVNGGKTIGRDGQSWKELRYPIQWIRTVLSPRPPSDITVAEWAIQFYRKIILIASIPENVKTRYDAHLRKHIVPALGSSTVSSLDAQVVTLLDRCLEKRGLAASKKAVRTTLWRMMESAVSNGIRSDNPVVYTPIPERRLEYQRARAQRRGETIPLQKDSTI